MKGIVVKIEKRKCILLDYNGNFVESRLVDNCEIGQEIKVRPLNTSLNVKKVLSLSLSLVFVFAFSLAAFAYYTPVSYVSVDINPSVELVSNMFDRVISVKGNNKEGEEIIKGLGIKNRRIEDAVSAIIEEAVDTGYLDDENIEEDVLVSVTPFNNKNKGENIASNINNSLTVTNKMAEGNGVVKVTNKDKYEEAKDLGVSIGRMQIVEKALEVDETLDEEELYNTSIKEINEILGKGKESSSSDKGKGNADEKETGKDEDKGNNKPEENKQGPDNSNVNNEKENQNSQNTEEAEDTVTEEVEDNSPGNGKNNSGQNAENAKENNNDGKVNKNRR